MQTGRVIPYTAESAVTRGRFVIAGTVAKNVVPAADGTEQPLGVAKYDAATGAVARIEIDGVVLVEAGAAVAIGAQVMPNASGKAITATSTNYSAGVALQAASADGDFIEIQLLSGGPL